MLIYVIAEQYPSLYKPYFDTQFAQFIRDGHELRIFALGAGFRTASWGNLPLDRSTQYLPTVRSSLVKFAPAVLRGIAAEPVTRFRALERAVVARPTRVSTLTDIARLAVLPARPPAFCLVHNLLAARRVRFLRDLYKGVPIAFYYHGGELPGVAEVSEREAAEAFQAADVVFTNTSKSRDHALARGCPADRIVLSPVGFSLEEFPQSAPRVLRRDGHLNILSIGRLSPEKGFRYSIEAIRRLVEAGHRALRYRIVGGGPLLSELEAQIDAARLAPYVELIGALPRERLLDEMRLSDVLMVPSIVVGTWEENQACVVQEAMLMQATVVATATGGVPESLAPELHQFLVPEGDAFAMAAQLDRIAALADAELARLGAAARAFAASRYDIRQLNQQVISETMGRRVGADRLT